MSNYQEMLSLLEQGINIFNSSDKFYTDLCYEYKFESNKDIALKDRIKLFYPNISLCKSGCTLKSVELKNYTNECECKFNDISNKKNNNKEKKEKVLIDNLIGDALDFVSYSNIVVGKCASKSVKFLKRAYGFYLILFLFIINNIFAIIFCMDDYNKIKIFIFNNTERYLKFIKMKNNNLKEPPIRKKKNFNKNNIININDENSKKEILKDNIKITKSTSKKTFDDTTPSTKLKKKKNKNPKKKKYLSHFFLHTENYEQYFEKFFSESPDEMYFEDAIKKDKRKLCAHFADNLKENQIISNTFCSNDLFKPRSIKIIIFVLNILFYFVINALFINDDYVSEVYYLEKENFFSFIPRSINRFFYNAIVGVIIEFIVGFFFEEEGKLKKIFLREKDNEIVIKAQVVILINSMKNKYRAFIIFQECIYGLCLYYIICFNSIYPNMQIEWIKSSIFIFIIRQILSVIQCLLVSILRFISLRTESEIIF